MAMPSCINHPEKESVLVLHDWQIHFSEGNKVAAGLMSIFEYWHNVKIKLQLKKTVESRHINDLMQFHTEKELIKQLMNITTTPANLRRAIKFLQQQGVITVHRNPNKRYGFDRTRHFLFHPDVVNKWLKTYDGKPSATTKCKKIAKPQTQAQQEIEVLDSPTLPPNKQAKRQAVVELEKPKVESQEQEVENDMLIENPSNELIMQALLQNLPTVEQHKATKIVNTLFNKELIEVIINEWQYALDQGKVKNKFSYLAGLVNRANQGKFHPTATPKERQGQKIVGIIKIPEALPEPSMAHEIFPPYEHWQEKQLAISELISKSEYMNFVLPVRAYESDSMIMLRCPNVYSYDFMKNNQDKVVEILGGEIKIYMG
jgi:hypothetical protein